MSIQSIHQGNTLKAIERLHLRKDIQMLFHYGKAFSFYPLRVIYRFVDTKDLRENHQSPVRAGFSIPKRRIRHASNRNRNRRLLKESWRLQKQTLYKSIPEQYQLHCFLIYIGNEMLTFDIAFQKTGEIMQKLCQQAEHFKEEIN